MLLGVTPRRRVAPAPKLLSQFVEPGCRFSPTSTQKKRLQLESFVFGTRGRTRTGTLLRAGDFESPVSTNFTTLA